MQVAAPGHAGGLESVLLDLSVGLHHRGHSILLVVVLDGSLDESPIVKRALEAGIEVRRIVVPPRAYRAEYRAIGAAIGSWRPGVIHTHGYRSDLVAGFAARRRRVPWVTTLHGFTGGGWKNRGYEWLQLRACRRAAGAVAVSRQLGARLEQSGVDPARIHLIPNAWSETDPVGRDEARRALAIPADGPPVIGWVGRFSPEKDADLFLDALALLPNLPWRASLIGIGRERGRLEEKARALGILARVTWHGLVPGAARYFGALDLFVLSSRTEGTPIALLEAMAARVPIVSTAVGGVPDVVGPAEALLVPPENPAALAEAIAEVLANRDAALRRASAARVRLEEHFSSAPWLDAHERLYARAARPTPSEA